MQRDDEVREDDCNNLAKKIRVKNGDVVNVALISHLHLEDLDRTGCQRRGGPGPGGHCVFVADEGL